MMTSPGAGMDMGHGMPMGMMDDQSFLSAMIPHHQMAIAMAQGTLERAEHPEIKQLAQNIITSQQAEIKQMQAWEHAWFPNATPTASPSMSQSEMGMTMDVNTLKTAQPFDKAFMEAMIPHHQGVIHMSQQVLQTTQRREIQELAHSIISAQQAEING
jgi:uncharacterized protein (DUF305 family)